MSYKRYKQYRLPNYDYSSLGDYFLTICTKDRIQHFGKIISAKSENSTSLSSAYMEYSPIGQFVKESITSIPETFKDVTLGETVVMPNHIHLIISLSANVGTSRGLSLSSQPNQSPLQKEMSPNKGLAALVPGSVSSIINHLKGKVKKWCNANGFSDFKWQARFHDRVIRNVEEFNAVSNYIANNIYKWSEDEDNIKGYL